MGEVDYAPGEPKGTPWHPHRGFETVTYMIDGTFLHQDSHGGGGVIDNGATQWMTAGAGILHIETPPEELVLSGGLFHGIQLWVNLPAKDKFTPTAVPEHRGRSSDARGVRRRRRARPDRRGEHRRPLRPRLDAHADHPGARDHRSGRDAVPALAAGLQRSGLRSFRVRHGRVRRAGRFAPASWRCSAPATG